MTESKKGSGDMSMKATKCACGAPAVVTNLQISSRQCWNCCAGPNLPMLRRVEILTDDGNCEVVCVNAGSNREAMRKLWAGRKDIKSMMAKPMPN
jgi:hypothetical protein